MSVADVIQGKCPGSRFVSLRCVHCRLFVDAVLLCTV